MLLIRSSIFNVSEIIIRGTMEEFQRPLIIEACCCTDNAAHTVSDLVDSYS